MPDYSEDEAREARRIVDGLLHPEQPSVDLENGISVSDIESDVAEFSAELQLLEAIDIDVPVARVGKGESVPVALSLLAGAESPLPQFLAESSRLRWDRHFRDSADVFIRSLFDDRDRGGGIATVPRNQARATFLDHATDFLATRISAVRDLDRGQSSRWSNASVLYILQRAGGPMISTPGCQFAVSTNTKGLRVFWSGAYRLSSNYFSHPTTPALGVLQSGTYVFGVDGGRYGKSIQWDLNAVVTLPGSPHAHLNY